LCDNVVDIHNVRTASSSTQLGNSEKEILSTLGKVLSNARDWHGGRKKNTSIPTSSAPSTPDSQEEMNTFFFVNTND